jgi:hypothetical protein
LCDHNVQAMVLPHHLVTFRDQLWLLFMIPNTRIKVIPLGCE